MLAIPFDTLSISTPLPPDKVLERIRGVVEPPKWFRLSRVHLPFQGSVAGRTFSICRIIHYRNSFLPRVRGTLRQESGGTQVTAYLYLHPFVIAFLVVWCCGIGAGGLMTLSSVVAGKNSVWLLLVPVCMFAFMYCLVMGCFLSEARKAKELLNSAVGGS